jgi:hypothetical protein
VAARFSAPIQTGSGSLLYNWYRFFFPGLKLSGYGVDHLPHLELRLKKQQSYTSAPHAGFHDLF